MRCDDIGAPLIPPIWHANPAPCPPETDANNTLAEKRKERARKRNKGRYLNEMPGGLGGILYGYRSCYHLVSWLQKKEVKEQRLHKQNERTCRGYFPEARASPAARFRFLWFNSGSPASPLGSRGYWGRI